MKIDKLIEMSKVQLEDELSSYQDSLLNLKFQKSLQQLEDSSQLSKTRRSIAQIKTILNNFDMESKTKQDNIKWVSKERDNL